MKVQGVGGISRNLIHLLLAVCGVKAANNFYVQCFYLQIVRKLLKLTMNYVQYVPPQPPYTASCNGVVNYQQYVQTIMQYVQVNNIDNACMDMEQYVT